MKTSIILLLAAMIVAVSGCSKATSSTSRGLCAYIGFEDGSIRAFAAESGRLENILPDAPTLVEGPSAMLINPQSRFAYVAGKDGGITRFQLGTDGTLGNSTTINSSVKGMRHLVLSPSGKFIYAALALEGVPGTIALIPVAEDGSLAASEVKYCGAGRSSNSVAMSPSGGLVYVSHVVGGGGISGFRVAEGDLLQVLAEDATTAAVGSFTEMAVSQDSKYLFACDVAENSIKCFGIDSTGKLTFIARAAYPEGYDTGSVKNIATDRYGNVLTATQGRQLMVYRLDNNQLKRVASYMCLKSGQFLPEGEVEDQLSQTSEYQKALERRSAMDEKDRNRYAMMEAKHKLCSQISSVKTTAEDDVYAASTSGIYRFRSGEAGLTFLSAALTWPDTLEQSRNRNTPQTERVALTQIKGGLVIWLDK